MARKQNKYGAVKTSLKLADGTVHKFDSKAEAERYQELRIRERAGYISNIRLQVKYSLIPSMKDEDGKAVRGITYIADFVYTKDGKDIVEDVKGVETDVYKLKKKLMLYVHGITVREYKKGK